MLKTYLYVPEELVEKINVAVRSRNKSKAQVIRLALEKGLIAINAEGTGSADALLAIADIGKKFEIKGPQDSSGKMDEYLWERDWAEDEKQT